MNGVGTEPPDKHQSNNILTENESVVCEMEMKQEQTVKQEPEDDDDIVTVSTPTNIANSVKLDNSIEHTTKNGNNNSDVFNNLDGIKPEVKTEKFSDKNRVPKKIFDRNQKPPNNVMKHFSKERKKKTDGPNGVAKKSAAGNKKKRKANSLNDQKKPFVGKANRKRHKCSLCDYVTVVKTNLNKHSSRHTEKPFPCTVCTKRFTRKFLLQSHMKIHVDKFLFSCSNCLQGFQHSEEMVQHDAGCKVRRYECHLCKEYSTLMKTHLKDHLRVHTGDKPFQCDHCSKKFNQARNLKQHHKTHTNPRPLKLKCSVCFKSFKQQTEKENHETNCKGRGYKCDVCKCFTTNDKANFLKHMRIHTGEKPFRCEICSKFFTQKVHLNRHKKIHK